MFTRHMTMYLWQKVMVVLFFFLHHYFCILCSSEPNPTQVEELTEEEQTKVSNFFFQLSSAQGQLQRDSLCYRFHHYDQLTSKTTGTIPVHGSRFFLLLVFSSAKFRPTISNSRAQKSTTFNPRKTAQNLRNSLPQSKETF